MRALFPALLVCLLAIAVVAAPQDQDLNKPLYRIFAGLALRQFLRLNPSAPRTLEVIAINSVKEVYTMPPIYALEFIALPYPPVIGTSWHCSAEVQDNYRQDTITVLKVYCKNEIVGI